MTQGLIDYLDVSIRIEVGRVNQISWWSFTFHVIFDSIIRGKNGYHSTTITICYSIVLNIVIVRIGPIISVVHQKSSSLNLARNVNQMSEAPSKPNSSEAKCPCQLKIIEGLSKAQREEILMNYRSILKIML
jgi:hypothetical protein